MPSRQRLCRFINVKSGGHVGPELAKRFAEVVGDDQVCVCAVPCGADLHLPAASSRACASVQCSVQVFDLSKDKPDKVIKKLYDNLEGGIQQGDKHAQHVMDNLRVLACGGDGTVAWVVTAIKCAPLLHAQAAAARHTLSSLSPAGLLRRSLNLHPSPATAVIPLGTGNGARGAASLPHLAAGHAR